MYRLIIVVKGPMDGEISTMQQQHPRQPLIPITHALTITISATLAACAPVPVDDERAQNSAYQRLFTYVATGTRKSHDARDQPAAVPTAPVATTSPFNNVKVPDLGSANSAPAKARNTQYEQRSTGPIMSVAPIPYAPSARETARPELQAPEATIAHQSGSGAGDTPNHPPKKSKSLFGFVTSLLNGKDETPEPKPRIPAQQHGSDLAEAEQEQAAEQDFATLYQSPNNQSAGDAPPVPANTPEVQQTSNSAKTPIKKGLSSLFSRVSGIFDKGEEETVSDVSKAELASSMGNGDPSTYGEVPTFTAESGSEIDVTQRNIQTQAFSAANPIYITALDLSINNLAKRFEGSSFALDERELAFLTKGALDEDTTYKFLTDDQLAAYRAKTRRNQEDKAGRSLFNSMKDFMPRNATADIKSATTVEPKTMTLLNSVIVMADEQSGRQRAIIMMKLQDNQTGIHLTDARRTIELTPEQSQSSLAIKRAIGAELPSMLDRLAKNAYASLTAPDRRKQQQNRDQDIKKNAPMSEMSVLDQNRAY